MHAKNPYWDQAAPLRKLYEERVPSGMSQEEFGAEYGIGTQGMVSQILNGRRPLNYDIAAKFARGLRCTIYDISPELASELETSIFPVLGRKMRRVAFYAALAILASPQAADVQAQTRANESGLRIMLKLLRRWLRRIELHPVA